MRRRPASVPQTRSGGLQTGQHPLVAAIPGGSLQLALPAAFGCLVLADQVQRDAAQDLQVLGTMAAAHLGCVALARTAAA